MRSDDFADRLLAWAATVERPMPWRGERDAYRVWLSEVILQQTRVAQGESYYRRFVAAYPTVCDLAAAEEPEVLALWQGLGYYSRARNLLRAARQVRDDHGGQMPRTSAELRELAGIGPYTAAAVASLAYDEPVAVVDGNVYRVLARVFGIAEPIDRPAGQRRFAELAQRLLPRDRAADYNQAIMDFGATVCTPRGPRCGACPLAPRCAARREGRQAELPVKAGRTQRRTRYFDYVHLVDARGRTLLRRRGAGDIWQGLYDFPLVEGEGGFSEVDVLRDRLTGLPWTRMRGEGRTGPLRHVLTHQELRARFWRFTLGAGGVADASAAIESHVWVERELWSDYATPRLVERYLEGGGATLF